MKYGFSYNGKHCTDMKCVYIPSATKRLVYPDYSVVGSDVAGMDGGYYYSSNLKVRTFALDCYFEDITEVQLRKISRWQDRKTAGKLVFDARPDVEYTVHPTKPFTPELYEHVLDGNSFPTYSGTFSMTFSAYDPFGYLTKKELVDNEDPTSMRTYCGILDESKMPEPPSPEKLTFLVYNCGTEPCGQNMLLRGKAPNGLYIRNQTNGTVCKLITLPEESAVIAIDAGQVGLLYEDSVLGEMYKLISQADIPATVAIDAENCRIRYGVGTSLDPYDNTYSDLFELHDEGYISLDPYDEVYENQVVSYTEGSNIYNVVRGERPDDSFVGKYMYVNGEWHRIHDVLSGGRQVVASNAVSTGTTTAMITTMNEIEIYGDGMSLADIRISYSPRVQ